MTFKKWLKINNLRVKTIVKSTVYSLSGKTVLLLSPKGGKIVGSNMTFKLSKEDIGIIKKHRCEAVAFEFGEKYYYTDLESKLSKTVVRFNDLKYIGKPKTHLDLPFVHLGVHGEYELGNGSHMAEDWVDKAKFLQHKALGICDRNTLAGTLAFQLACQKQGLKHIIGETVTIMCGEDLYDGKLFVRNKQGWRNLLKINKAINVDNENFIYEEDLLKFGGGLIFVFTPDSILSNTPNRQLGTKIAGKYRKAFDSIYFQIDSVEYESDEIDVKYLDQLGWYCKNMLDVIEPVLINDSYYIDSEESSLKTILNYTAGVVHPHSENQHYKTLDESYLVLSKLFKDQDMFLSLFLSMVENTVKIAESCDFDINVGQHKLPKFQAVTMFEVGGDIDEFEDRVQDFWESKQLDVDDYNGLFFYLLEQGLVEKLGKPSKKYMKRLAEECNVIVNAGFIDYFLILWDIIKWSKSVNKLVGNARGSVAGSLVAYLLDITDVDPIKYGLLFERFLNKTRVSGERAKSADALPDIDVDFEDRDAIIKYMEYKYGTNYVCCIGAYDRIKPKSAIKDFGKYKGLSFSYRNFITDQIGFQLKYKWGDIFKYALESKPLMQFVQNNPEIINLIKFVLNQSKTATIHASAVVIVPTTDEDGEEIDVFGWMPVKKMPDKNGGFLLVSEWEGKYIERAGFLKEDVLGLSQLNKFQNIQRLVKKYYDEDVVLRDIPLDTPEVYKMFSKGYVEDVFQFGSDGLREYCKKLKPKNIEHLIAANALYRPGPMSSNAHEDYIKILRGLKKPQFDYGLAKVTEETAGLYIYQEQIMKAVNVLGNLSLSEADEVRTVMKKFDKAKMATFREKFIKGAVSNGCPDSEAKTIWDKLERFSGYGFNRSHAAAYSIMAYWSMYLKWKFPLAFAITSLQYSSDKQVPYRLFEIKKTNPEFGVNPPDINLSGLYFTGDVARKQIFWALSKIKGIGVSAVNKISEERRKTKFSSLEDFVERMKGKGFGKDKVKALILSGAFDNVESVKHTRQRRLVLAKFYTILGEDFPEQMNVDVDSFWVTQQKQLTGFGNIDFMELLPKSYSRYFMEITSISMLKLRKNQYKTVVVAGNIDFVREKKTKQGKKFALLRLRSNDGAIDIMVWPETWAEYKKMLEEAKAKKFLVAFYAQASFDSYRNGISIYTNKNTKITRL